MRFLQTPRAPFARAHTTLAPLLHTLAPLRRATLALTAALALLATLAPPGAQAATPLSWTHTASGPAAGSPLALSCPSSSLCVAVSGEDAFVSGNPSAAGAGWGAVQVAAGKHLTSVSCPSTAECVAVDSEGEAFVSGNPGAPGSWGAVAVASASTHLTGVSCGATNLCVAVAEEGDAFVSGNPGAPGSWGALGIDPGHALTGVSCASAGLCVAVDSAGDAIASPAPASTWTVEPIAPGGSPLLSVACEASGACAATDQAGDALTSTNPTASEATANAAGPEWSTTNLKAGALSAVSCASSVCVAGSVSGVSFANESLAARPASWGAAAIGDSGGLDAISCVPGSVCVAVANPSGTLESFAATIPQPPAEKPAEKPAPPPPSLATPSPLINGDPAAGQTLECEPRLPAGALATLAYQWYAGEQAIAGATNQNYKVLSGDEGEHLRCAVTATNAAGSVEQTSGWVAVPRAQAPKSVGETTVSEAKALRDGRVSFSVECSAHAVGRCEIEAKLIAYERFHGKTLLGVSAKAPASARSSRAGHGRARAGHGRARASRAGHGRAHARASRAHRQPAATRTAAQRRFASRRRARLASAHSGAEGKREGSSAIRFVEATLGTLKVTVKPGHTRKLNVRLDAAGLTLAKRFDKRKLPVTLTVSGTVVGVLTGQLSSQTLALPPATAHHPAHHHAKGKKASAPRGHAGRAR